MAWIATALILTMIALERKHRLVLLAFTQGYRDSCPTNTTQRVAVAQPIDTLTTATTGVLNNTLTHFIPLGLDFTQ